MINVGNGAQVQQTRLEKGNVPVQGKSHSVFTRRTIVGLTDDDLAFEKYARRECRVALQNSEHRRRNNVVVRTGDNQSCSNNLE